VTTGERIRRAIKRRYGDISQTKVAEKLEVPTGNLSEWLNDKYEPTLDSLRWLADKLSCSVASLIGDEAA
jgi:transcriptional regulator with XRE-family HTH domain